MAWHGIKDENQMTETKSSLKVKLEKIMEYGNQRATRDCITQTSGSETWAPEPET